MLEEIIGSFSMVFTLTNILGVVLGLILGLFIGAMPGMGAVTGMTLLLPFTYYVSPLLAIVFLMALSKGVYYGDCVPGILFKMPGTASSAITTIDGHQLTLKGEPKRALQGALYGSVGGDLMSDIVLLLSAAPLAMAALRVGPAENSIIILFSLTIIGMVVLDDPAKGMVAVSLGMIFGTVGRDPFTFGERFTFGIFRLQDGIRMVPYLIGLLVISEIFVQLSKGIKKQKLPDDLATEQTEVDSTAEEAHIKEDRIALKDARVILPSILRGGLIGTAVGAIPGLGGTVGGFVAYTQAKRTSKYPAGSSPNLMQGMVSSEAANSAVNGANLIPLLALGIPGSATAAVLYAAFMIQGITPGPFIMQRDAQTIYALLVTLILANIVLFLIGPYFVHVAKQALRIPKQVLYPCIFILSTVAIYSVQRTMFDVRIVFIFAVLGFFMKKLGFPVLPAVIAFYLAPIFEEGSRRSLLISGGDYSIFYSSGISIFFLVATVLSLAYTIYSKIKESRKKPID